MAAEGRRNRAAKSTKSDSVGAESISKGGSKRTSGLHTTEVVDAKTGRVTETNCSIVAPTLATKDVIADKRYCRIRGYLLARRLQIMKAEEYRNTVFPPNWKQVRRKPKRVVSSVRCPDCDGSGYARKGDCPRCNGNGWITAS